MKIKTKNQNLGDRAKTALKGTFTALNTLHQKTKEVLKSVTLAMTLRNQKMKVKLKTQKPMKQKRKKINETESPLFIGKISKIDKPIAKLIKEKEKEKDKLPVSGKTEHHYRFHRLKGVKEHYD